MSLARRLGTVVLACAAAGCATLEAELEGHWQSGSAAVRECAAWYRRLDAETDATGVRDGQYARVPGFPYLRVDRFHASLRDRAAGSRSAFQGLAARLLELDAEARAHEMRNLGLSRAEIGRARECGLLLGEADLALPERRAVLLDRLRVPDDYSDASRLLGLYVLTRIAFLEGVKRWQESTEELFRRSAQGPTEGPTVRFAPPAAGALSRAAVAGMLGRAALDPLGLPILSEAELDQVAAAYAPSFEIAISGDHDRFGELRWRREADLPEVNAAETAVYVHSAYAHYGARVLLQLVYTIWFPERPPEGRIDLVAGRLDGLVWRVTLAPDGAPLIYDSIHPCGCYHQFFPTPRARPRPAPYALEEWAFSPQSLPEVGEGERPVVMLASRTHRIQRVTLTRGSDSVARYVFHPYSALRSLRTMAGSARSVFGPAGLIAGSERAERFLFWPMGIESAGAMRQWGRQPTAFVGRRHFDDPDLLERRFELDLRERSK